MFNMLLILLSEVLCQCDNHSPCTRRTVVSVRDVDTFLAIGVVFCQGFCFGGTCLQMLVV